MVVCTLGVLLHPSMYFQARQMDHHRNGMPMDLSMTIGMTFVAPGCAHEYGLGSPVNPCGSLPLP
ncbi:hypothetical protein [Streptomyces sp. NPDC058872]|uniref:hypothetical protein n=1 Tax=Streptomyces sp. NPDC058872 TaxID=3346661 RepID=UPI003699C809